MNLGKLNYWFTRTTTIANRFIQPANFIMLILLTAKEQPIAWLLIPGGILGALCWIWFDHNYVLERELDYQYGRMPMFRDMVADVKEIKTILEEKK